MSSLLGSGMEETMDYEAQLRKQSRRNDFIANVLMWPFAVLSGVGVLAVVAMIPGTLFWLAWNYLVVPATGWPALAWWAACVVWFVFSLFFRSGSKS